MPSQMVLSLSDLIRALSKKKNLILFNGIWIGVLFFLYFLFQPLTYEVTATFKAASGANPNSLSKLLDGPQATLPDFTCYAVVESCVEALHLQGYIEPLRKKENDKFFNKCKAERIYLQGKKISPEKTSLFTPLMRKEEHPLKIEDLAYTGNLKAKLKITFTNEQDYLLKTSSGVLLGSSSLGKPLIWGENSLTLNQGDPCLFTGKIFVLKLEPLTSVTHSLKNKIIVKKDVLQKSLFHISYKHQDGDHAALVINTLMKEYERYLCKLSDQKIQAHLHYLGIRKAQAKKEIVEVIEEQKENLSRYIDANEFGSFIAESEFINEQQANYFIAQSKLKREIEELDLSLMGKKRSFQEILAVLPEKVVSSPEILRERILDCEERIDNIESTLLACEDCLEQLDRNELMIPEIKQLLEIPSLASLFARMRKIERDLVDKANFSEKEQAQLCGQLNVEKKALAKDLSKLKKSSLYEKKSLIERIQSLQHDLLIALGKEHQEVQKQLSELGISAKHLPQKWLEHTKVEGITSIEAKVIQVLTQLVETNNLNEYMAPFSCLVIKWATTPSLVNPPFLVLGFLIGLCIGIFLTVGYITCVTAAQGPSASSYNLRVYGYTYLGKFSSWVTHIYEKLKRRDHHVLLACLHAIGKKKVILLHQKDFLPLSELLAFSFAKERTCIVDLIHHDEVSEGLLAYLNQEIKSVPLIHKGGYDKLPLGKKHMLEDLLLLREDFFMLLEQLKMRYDRLLIVSHKTLSQSLFVKLSTFGECILMSLDEERMEDLSLIDASKGCFFEQERYAPPSLPVHRIRRVLTHLLAKRKTFFSIKY